MNAYFVYAIAAFAASATLLGAIRFFGRRSDDARDGETFPEPPRIEVLSRTAVGSGRSLVLVQFEGRRILLGLTRGQWTALADLGRAPQSQDPASTIDAELNRALKADRLRRGRRSS
ncbi:MAG: flagellar biosynthetic protein FliO [Candidatus Eisenbacteria bacterium]|uniref:Flagellar biosynthetic protein FliO n=1 Tax=Eiseniibacteriota bacterium TaxID=2212470 RepID=A0A538TAC2_UNCEI|nr:MAG: flagellar biosynthetic protein FliO [Candidatus Eisenbacteria bacterium]